MHADAARVSFLPSDAVQGGSLSDIDALIYRARFAAWDYRGKADPCCALLVTYLPQDFRADWDGDEEKIPDHFTQAYSCGPLDKYTPSEDGTYVIAAGSAKGFNKSSNVIMFFTALVNKGFSQEKLGEGDISCLDEMLVHLVQVAQPKREGLKGGGDEGANRGITLIDKILAYPGETPTGAPATPATPAPATVKKPATTKKTATATPAATTGQTPAAPAPTAGSSDIVSAAHEAIMALVVGNGGKITKAEIAGKIFKQLAGETDTARKNLIIQAAYKDDTLKTGPWQYDGTTVTMG